MYLTYDEYEELGGSSITEEAYARIEAKARAIVDRCTFSRLKAEKQVRESVTLCVFDLVNAFNAEESLGPDAYGREIASMSNDGLSVSFAGRNATGRSTSAFGRYASIVRAWLSNEYTADGVPLLYAGVSVR